MGLICRGENFVLGLGKQSDYRCQIAVDKPSLKHKFPHVAMAAQYLAVWRTPSSGGYNCTLVWLCGRINRALHSLPSHQCHLCALAPNRGETFEKLHMRLWKVLLWCRHESNASIYFRHCCGIQISADAIHFTSLSTYVPYFIFIIHVYIYANDLVKLTQVTAVAFAKVLFKFTSDGSLMSLCTSRAAVSTRFLQLGCIVKCQLKVIIWTF